jgi:hypothetical protein
MRLQEYLLLLTMAALPSCALFAQDRVRPMPVNADPSFEVVSIRLANPDNGGKDFEFEGQIFRAQNYNVNDLIALAYGMHPNQILGAPGWFGSALFDIQGIPDVEGTPKPAPEGPDDAKAAGGPIQADISL